ncbi:SGNH/GDSL hydrolase family protein [Halalkalibacter krulwichiae]|uniref:GDSL-like Lipase/Acylhydrolase n=1 Tax=Halalkalibacter krulwichiae TaxID=199441 RepID=A0A1X9ME93_9BACI|nr:SGNH/GDSL hydrolase family protein [Halalkalibacter krulwichiae]ARK30860.1 GDSL-like Lipase/Acylhydrolase [Halalkalibacter krulwichiae]
MKVKILFIGDSITDCGRLEDQEGLGTGYVRLVRDYLLASYPAIPFQFVNVGISGNRITDLVARWQEDVLNHKPDFVSISIGINDVWRQLDRPDLEQVTPELFKSHYIDLVTKVQEQTNAKIILMEPTIIGEQIDSTGNKLLIDYVKIVNELADHFKATVIPTHQAFIIFLQSGSTHQLTTDSVHMSSIGNMLMAKTWLKAVEGLLK